MNLRIFQREEEVVSLFFIHWSAVCKDPWGKDGSKEKKKGDFPLVHFYWCWYCLLWDVRSWLFCHRVLSVFRDLLKAGNSQAAFCLTSDFPALAATSGHHPHPPTPMPPVISPLVLLFQGVLESRSGWPSSASPGRWISGSKNLHGICLAKFWKFNHS